MQICIIYDRLISEDILRLPKKDAELIYLGKGNTEGGLIQDEINQTLVKKCLEGKSVARVKGGDPFVFGRGGEEVEALFQNEIEFEIIPGITSFYICSSLCRNTCNSQRYCKIFSHFYRTYYGKWKVA